MYNVVAHDVLVERLESLLKHQLTTHAAHAKRLLVAVSGGSDSVALLRLLLAIAKDAKVQLEVAHFHHHIRPLECQRDADFTVALCRELDVPYHLEEANIPRIAQAKKMNQEACSRQLRYAFLHRVAKKIEADAIVTAHNQDDQAETVVMQLMRGAAFLTGIVPKKKFLLRPLLGISRVELQSYLIAIGQDFVLDSTNFDTDFSRAWIRHQLLPLWSQRQADIKVKLARLATKQQQQAAHFAMMSAPILHNDPLDLRDMQALDEAMRQYVLAQRLRELELPLHHDHLEKLSDAIQNHAPDSVQRFNLGQHAQHHYARIGYDELRIINPRINSRINLRINFQAQKRKSGFVNWWSDANIPPEMDAQKLRDLVQNGEELEYRTRRSGDFIQLEKGRKKLNALLIDRKIPREERDSIALLAIESEVLWVEGVEVSTRVRNFAFRSDAYWMGLALEQAQQAFNQGEIPVGAVIVHQQHMLAAAHNRTEQSHDPSAHAEVLVLRQAAQALGDWRLGDCRLYVTLEPCLMCLGAMLQAQLPAVIYGADNPREGALGGVANIQHHTWKRRMQVTRGLRAREASDLLTRFFEYKRAN